MYMFNLKHLYRIFHGVSSVKPSQISDTFDVAKLWAAEAFRTLVDRVDDKEERRIFNIVIQDNAYKYFKLDRRTNIFPSKMGRPFYSHIRLNSVDFESTEVEKLRSLKSALN